MMSDLLHPLILATASSSVAMLLVLALRKPMRLRFGTHAAYALWALVPLSALVASLPAPVASMSMQIVPMAITAVATSTPISAPPMAIPFDPSPWLAGLWLLGTCIVCLLFARQQRRFVRALGQVSNVDAQTLRAQTTAGCPALLGAWRPRIVLPADFEQRYSAIERELILAHERTHRARGDAQINALAAALRCVFWFNPLMHFAASRFRFDQELACDAVVISRFPEARRSYADAMLKTQLADFGLPVGCHWQSSHPLKERIAMLKQPLPGRVRAALGAAISATLIIGGTYAAWAAQPTTQRNTNGAAGADAIEADLVLSVDGHPVDSRSGWSSQSHSHFYAHDPSTAPYTFVFRNPDGAPFALAIFNGGERWQIDATVNAKSDGTFEFVSILKHGDKIVSQPRLIVRAGEQADIKVGQDAGERGFQGFAAQIALARVEPAHAAASITTDKQAGYRKLSRIAYPAESAASKVEGVVYVKAHVAVDGRVTGASIDRIDPATATSLGEAAVAGVKAWTFDAAQKRGKPTASDEIVPVVFALNQQTSPKISGATLDAIRIMPPDPAEIAEQAGDEGPTEITESRRLNPPKYPKAAMQAHQSGKITLKVLVDEHGNAKSATVFKAEPPEAAEVFADTSIEAAMQWKFNPATKDGKPHEGAVLVPVDFSLTR